MAMVNDGYYIYNIFYITLCMLEKEPRWNSVCSQHEMSYGYEQNKNNCSAS